MRTATRTAGRDGEDAAKEKLASTRVKPKKPIHERKYDIEDRMMSLVTEEKMSVKSQIHMIIKTEKVVTRETKRKQRGEAIVIVATITKHLTMLLMMRTPRKKILVTVDKPMFVLLVLLGRRRLKSSRKEFFGNLERNFQKIRLPVREGVAPLKDAGKKGIPPNARWTKIDRKLVNPEALDMGNERYEERIDYVIVLRVLTKEEIEQYAKKTQEIRGKRELLAGDEMTDELTSDPR